MLVRQSSVHKRARHSSTKWCRYIAVSRRLSLVTPNASAALTNRSVAQPAFGIHCLCWATRRVSQYSNVLRRAATQSGVRPTAERPKITRRRFSSVSLTPEMNAARDPNMKRTWNARQGIVFTSTSAPVQSAIQGISDLRVASTDEVKTDSLSAATGVESHDTTVGPAQADKIQVRKEIREVVPPPLLYQIPKDVQEKNLESFAAGKEVFWSYHMYCNEKDGKRRPPIVHYCRKRELVERACQYFVNDETLGFDLEWKVNASKGSPKQMVSLVQIANAERIALFHIALHRDEDDIIAPTLKKILEDPKIRKVGVAISGDTTRLRKAFGVESRSIFELSHLYKLVAHFDNPKLINRRLVKLTTIAETHFGLPLEKEEVRSSDWTAELDLDQIRYAANDAYASVRLFDVMNRKRLELEPVPPLPFMAELKLPIRVRVEDPVSSSSEESDQELDLDLEVDEDSMGSSDESSSASEGSLAEVTPPTTTRRSTRSRNADEKDTSKTTVEKDDTPTPAEVLLADEWVATYLANRPVSSRKAPGAAPLRAYSLWQQQGMDVDEITKLLRRPPLATTTVASYIMSCVHQEELECDVDRAKVVLQKVHEGMPSKRYWQRRLEALDNLS